MRFTMPLLLKGDGMYIEPSKRVKSGKSRNSSRSAWAILLLNYVTDCKIKLLI
jgi:hypothetical protein